MLPMKHYILGFLLTAACAQEGEHKSLADKNVGPNEKEAICRQMASQVSAQLIEAQKCVNASDCMLATSPFSYCTTGIDAYNKGANLKSLFSTQSQYQILCEPARPEIAQICNASTLGCYQNRCGF